MERQKFTAVIGDSNRIVSVQAEDKDSARVEITRQLLKNAQRREIWAVWQADGAAIGSEGLEDEFDEAQANAEIRGKLRSLLAELDGRASRGGPGPQSALVFYAIEDARNALKAYDRRGN